MEFYEIVDELLDIGKTVPESKYTEVGLLVGWCDMTYDVVVCACMCVTCMLVSVECWVLGNASWLLSVVYGVWSSGLASTRRSGWLAVNVKFVVSLVEGGIMIDVTVCKCVSFRLGL